MKRSPFIIWVVLLLFLVNSCKLDNLDFNKLSKEVNLSPAVVAPVAKANITVWDLVQSANTGNIEVITKDPGGLIKIIYKQNDLYKYNVRDLLKFPVDQPFSSGEKVLGDISPANVSISRNITLTDLANSTSGALNSIVPLNGLNLPFPAFSFPGPAAQFGLNSISDFTDITLSKGTLEIVIENKLHVPISISGTLFDVKFNKKIADFTFTSIAKDGGTNKTSVSLAGVQLSNKLEFRMNSFDTPGSTAPVIINLANYFTMTFNLIDLGISKGNLMVKNSQTLEGSTGSFGFNFPEAGMKAYSSVLKKGTMTIKTTNTSQLTGTINFTLSEIKKNGVPIVASVPLSGNSTTIDLAGANINFSADPVQPYNRIPYIYSLMVNRTTTYIDYSSSQLIRMDITLNNLEFQSVTGDFGKRAITIDKGLFDMNVDLLNKISGSFKLANPNLTLTIHNSIGMPASVGLNFTASNKDGKTVTLDPPAFDIPVPASLSAEIATKSIVFNKSNSNIVNFIALPPSGQISYSGKVDFNKDPVTPQNPNFLDVDATFAIDMAMELPMELQTSNLTFKDTTGISGSDFKKLETADLIINAKNGIPLDIDLQLFFVDTISKKQYGSSKKTKILSAAQVNATGVITPSQSSNTFSLDAVEMVNLRKANGIVFVGTLSSPSGGTTVAPILWNSKIELNAVIKSKVNL